MNMVVVFDFLAQLFRFISIQLNIFAKHFALLIDVHFDLIASIHNAITSKNFTKIFRFVTNLFRRMTMNW